MTKIRKMTVKLQKLLSAMAFICLVAVPAFAVEQVPQRPYSCRLYDDEIRKCAFGGCDRQTVKRLERQCVQDGGRP